MVVDKNRKRIYYTILFSKLFRSVAEYGEGQEVSTHGDVYSLGIVLIEMFTRRRPTDDMFRGGLNLHCFAEAALPDKVMEIADSRICLHHEAKNSNAAGYISRTKECLAAFIQLGVLCSKQLPKDRPSISDAAVEMHNIRDTYLSTVQGDEDSCQIIREVIITTHDYHVHTTTGRRPAS